MIEDHKNIATEEREKVLNKIAKKKDLIKKIVLHDRIIAYVENFVTTYQGRARRPHRRTDEEISLEMENNKERDTLNIIEYAERQAEPEEIPAEFEYPHTNKRTYEELKPFIKKLLYQDADELEIGLFNYGITGDDEPYCGNYWKFTSQIKDIKTKFLQEGSSTTEKDHLEKYDIETLENLEHQKLRLVDNIKSVEKHHDNELERAGSYGYGGDVYLDVDKDLLRSALKDIQVLSPDYRGTFQGIVEKNQDGTLVIKHHKKDERYFYENLQEKDLGKTIEVNVETAYQKTTEAKMNGGYDSFEIGVNVSYKIIENINELPQIEKTSQRTR